MRTEEENLQAAIVLHMDASHAREAVTEVCLAKLKIVIEGEKAILSGDEDQIQEVAVQTISETIDRICQLTLYLATIVDVETLDLCQGLLAAGIEGSEGIDTPYDKAAHRNHSDAQRILELWRPLITQAPEIIGGMALASEEFLK